MVIHIDECLLIHFIPPSPFIPQLIVDCIVQSLRRFHAQTSPYPLRRLLLLASLKRLGGSEKLYVNRI